MKYQKLSCPRIIYSDLTREENECSSPFLRNCQDKKLRNCQDKKFMICSAWIGWYLTHGLLHLWKVYLLLKERREWPGLKPHRLWSVKTGFNTRLCHLLVVCPHQIIYLLWVYRLIKLAFQILIDTKLELWK